ncbi:MAG: hypothetical protein ITG02_01560 [Patulibacter sp.]|nr:hypothetical protein [Patulibacter sp.]
MKIAPVFVIVGALLLVAAPTAQAGYVGSGADPAGDAVTGNASHDIRGVAMAYDPDRGELRAQVRLAGTPDPAAEAELNVFAGRRGPTGCSAYPAIGFSSLVAGRGSTGVRLNGGSVAPITVSSSKDGTGDAVQEFRATAPIFRRLAPDCVIATTFALGNAAAVYDTAGSYAVRGVAGLEVQLGKAPSALRPGQTRTIRVTLRNPGHAATGRIRLSVPKARGMTARIARRVGSIAAGKQRTLSLRVRLSSRAKTTTELRVKATAPKKLAGRAETTLRLRKPSSEGGGGGGGSGGPKLCYRYTWYPPYGELRPC